jgi:large subunit ribosomal protein L32e
MPNQKSKTGTRKSTAKSPKKKTLKDKKPSTGTTPKPVKRTNPVFKRIESDRYGRLSTSWRYPKGIDNKSRKKRKGWQVQPGAGYGNPRVIRGLHPSGLKDHLVHRPEDLIGLDPDEDGIRIATKVGMRKRLAIRDKADEIGLVIFNPSRFDIIESEMDLESLEEIDEDIESEDLEEDTKKSKKRKSKK